MRENRHVHFAMNDMPGMKGDDKSFHRLAFPAFLLRK
jgi:hypothetical protein